MPVRPADGRHVLQQFAEGLSFVGRNFVFSCLIALAQQLFRGGKLNEELWNIFADNCRIPALNWGDMTACVAALDKAGTRLQSLTERYGNNDVEQAIYATLDRTELLARKVLARIPVGEYQFVEYFEDDYVSEVPVRLALKLTARGDGTIGVIAERTPWRMITRRSLRPLARAVRM